MDNAHTFLENLALVLCTSAVTAFLFQRLRQPVVFGYLVAGMIVGPYLPVPITADEKVLEALSELGVILLMFSLGLEFRLNRVGQIAATSGLAALLETSTMMGLGYLAGYFLGFTTLESVFTGAIVAISSTTIIARAFDENNVVGRIREVVFGILIVEDLIAIEVTSVSKRPEPLAEAASAIQVITREEIRRSGATSIPEALRLASNLQVAQVNASQWAISASGFNTKLSP